MIHVPRKTLLAAGLAAAWAVAGACAEGEKIEWAERAVPGPATTLRLKRGIGKYLIYEGSLARAQRSGSSYEEADKFYLNVLCADQQEGRDMLAMQRTFFDRKRIEKLENGKTIDRIMENSNDLLNLGPNSSIVGTLRCYAFDPQNRLAYRTTQVVTLNDGRQYHGSVVTQDDRTVVFITDQDKLELPRANVVDIADVPTPHVCLNETPHYLFPMFSERAVAPGETWRFRMPVIMPIEHGAAARVLPTQFEAVFTGRLRAVRDTGEGKLATVDYHVSGLFDSDLDEFKARLPAVFTDNRVVHKLTGDGVVVVDVEKGRIVTKTEAFTIVFYASGPVAQGDKPPKIEENKAEITSRFELKLLAPGTKLLSGAVIPPYD
jgi:hypothetical protein